jgi:signal transduction histidine kinase
MWLDAAGNATWRQARTETFAPVDGNVNLGYQPGVLWVRMQVQRGENLSGQPLDPEWWLEVPPAFLDRVTLWIEPSVNVVKGQAAREPPLQQAGAAIHPDQRPRWHRNSVFLVNLHEAGLYTLWLRVQSDNVKAVAPVLWRANALEQKTQVKTMVAGLFYGIFIFITLSALILGFTVGTPIFLMCAGFIFLLGLNLFVSDGWFALWLLPAYPRVADAVTSGCMALLIPVFFTVFSRLLLVNRYLPRLFNWYLRIAWAVALVAVLLLLGGHFSQVAPVVNMLAMLQLMVIFVLALWVIKREPSLRWVLLTLAPLLLPGMFRLARNAGVDFYIGWVDSSLLVGITLHSMFLLFFVARHVGRAYKSNLQARAEVIAGAAQLVEQRDFVALLSHEFRNPIAALDGALSNLNRQFFDPATNARVGRMTQSLERIKYVLGYCLADERMGTLASAQHLRLPLTVADIIEESLQQLDDASNRLQLHAVNPASQALIDGAHVLGELPLLGAALKNLVDNALKYDPHGYVLLSAHVQDRQVTFMVRDHGPGLDSEARSRLFEKFTRGQQHLSTPGAGLGLYLSRMIAQRHGGDIRIHNASGGGTLAEFSLPLFISRA